MKVQNGVLPIILFCLILFPGIVFSQTVKVNWNDNTEGDLAGYKLYCGTDSGSYQYVLNVGLNKPIYLKGLQDGLTYYFAVSAYDWSCNESSLSSEIQQTFSTDSPSDELINVVLQPKEYLYQLGTYNPASSMTLQNTLAGIRIEIPAGASRASLPVALGSDDPSSCTTTEFDIAPDGFVLSAPAVITAPVNSGGKTVYVELLDEATWVRIEGFSISSNIVRFSTQKLGRFRIYPDGVDPDSRNVTENGESFVVSGGGNAASKGGGGGGGCFIQSAHEPGGSYGPLSILLLVLLRAVAYRPRKEPV